MIKLILTILISLATITSAQEFVAGKVKNQFGRSGLAIELNETAVCSQVSGVQSFCKSQGSCEPNATVFVCNVVSNPIMSPCPESKTYCVGDPGKQSCSDIPGPFCAKENSICKGPGYYPDPSDCYSYHYCFKNPAKGSIESITYQCPIGAPFNPLGAQDRKCQVGAKCVSVNCTNNYTEEWRSMNYDNYTINRIGVKCEYNSPSYVHICPGGLSLDLNVTSSEVCYVKCSSNYQKAVFEDDNTMYYVCILGKGYLRRCEFGQKFNGEKLECEF